MEKFFLFFALLLMVGLCHAQEEDVVFVPDRPGYVWGTEVLAHHKISWENGIRLDQPFDDRVLAINSTIIRYGLFENVEVRVGADFLTGEGYDFQGMGVSPLTIGTKIKCYEGEGLIPSVGILAEFRSPHIGSSELRPSHIAPLLYLLLEQSIGEKLSLCYNAGLEFDGEDAKPTKYLGVGVCYSFTDQLGGFVEFNNYFNRNNRQYLPEFGMTWMITNRLQLALSAGYTYGDLRYLDNICLDLSWMIN